MYGRTLGLTIGFLLTFSVSAEVVHFECSVVYDTGTEYTQIMNIDMTEKVWETEDHTYSDVVISQSAIRASETWEQYGMINKGALFLSREDLSFSSVLSLVSKMFPSITSESHGDGICKIVEAPKVKRAF